MQGVLASVYQRQLLIYCEVVELQICIGTVVHDVNREMYWNKQIFKESLDQNFSYEDQRQQLVIVQDYFMNRNESTKTIVKITD